MSTVNLYDVLNVAQDCTTKEIKDAYRGLVKEFHPDKPSGDAEMFELITHAYNVLINNNSRKEYDNIYALSKQVDTNHFDLKIRSSDYFTALDNDSKKKKTKNEMKIDFDKIFDDMDRKHGYKREKEIIDKIPEKDTTKRLRDLQMAREHDDIESIHEKIFDEEAFGLSKFNAVFDALYKGPSEMIPHQGNPLAYNLGLNNDVSFSSIDNYEDLYDDNEISELTNFGSVKSDLSRNKKLSKSEIKKLSSTNYTDKHNYIEKDYNKTLEEKIKERENYTKKLDDREMGEFDNDLKCGGYGIFEQIGIKNLESLDWNGGDDIKTKYKKLLDIRKTNLN